MGRLSCVILGRDVYGVSLQGSEIEIWRREIWRRHSVHECLSSTRGTADFIPRAAIVFSSLHTSSAVASAPSVYDAFVYPTTVAIFGKSCSITGFHGSFFADSDGNLVHENVVAAEDLVPLANRMKARFRIY